MFGGWEAERKTGQEKATFAFGKSGDKKATVLGTWQT